MVFSTKPSVHPRWAKTAVIGAVFPACHPSLLLLFGNFTKLLASAASSHYPLLVNPFSLTGTSFGPIM